MTFSRNYLIHKYMVRDFVRGCSLGKQIVKLH